MTRFSITADRLTPAQITGVLALAEAARDADGMAPLSEHVLLHLRYYTSDSRTPGSPSPDRDLILALNQDPEGSEGSPAGSGGSTEAGASRGRGQSAGGGAPRGRGQSAGGGAPRAGGEIAGYAHLDAPASAAGTELTAELAIHPGHRREGLGLALVRALAAEAAGHAVRLWAHGDLPAAAALARAAGFDRVRALWQMRRPLAGRLDRPRFPPGITLRTFRPGLDEDEWLSLNRRAFAGHPEQGTWTRRDLELREREPWFDPVGFFIAERNGAMAGFHWTKVHGPAEEGIGEVYVVGVDPGEQGTGLGRALTLAGLHHLQGRGLAEVMLYVDEDNVPAIRLYEALGFTRWRTDAMYRQPRGGTPPAAEHPPRIPRS
jgi:mycothiol synthase